jgi:hypothetical protein
MSEPNIINNINQNDNNEFISPIENLSYYASPSQNTSLCDPPKKKKFPNFPIKNIYLPELFLDQEYIDQLKCGICENICDDPVIPCCGCDKMFCKKCLLFYYDNNHNECPECKKATKDFSKVSALDTIIKLKTMKCINYKENCTWKGKFSDYKEHITNKCPKEIINCPYKGCIIKLRREEMDNHMKDCKFLEIVCDKCKLKIPKNEIDAHKNICLKELIECPQGCKNKIERGDFNLHKQSCLYSFIDCPFNIFGCEEKFKRIEKEKRLKEDAVKHLNLTIEKILNMQNEIKELNQKLKNFENDLSEFKKKEAEDIMELKSNKKNFNEQNPNQEKNANLFEYENGVKNNQGMVGDTESKSDKYKTTYQKNLLSNKRKLSNSSIFPNNIDSFNLSAKENDEDMNSEFSMGQQVMDLYDLSHLEADIQKLFLINNNIISSNNLKGKKQYYIFFNKRYDIPKTSTKVYRIKYKLLKETQWLGIGVCDKKIVEKNNFDFSPPKKINGKTPNIGTYVITTSKMAWNCNNVSQCRKYSCLIKNESIFELIISPTNCEVEFKCDNKLIVKFNDVRCFKSNFFSPCLIFLHNSMIQSNFYYSD